MRMSRDLAPHRAWREQQPWPQRDRKSQSPCGRRREDRATSSRRHRLPAASKAFCVSLFDLVELAPKRLHRVKVRSDRIRVFGPFLPSEERRRVNACTAAEFGERDASRFCTPLDIPDGRLLVHDAALTAILLPLKSIYAASDTASELVAM